MATPVQMTSSTLNALKNWPSYTALDFAAPPDATLASVTVVEGSVLHLSATGTLLLGVGNTAVMPLFNFQKNTDNDVVNNGGTPATQVGVWVGIEPPGLINCLVATGAYELVSTNYYTGTSYPPNTHLTSPTTASGGVNAGQLTSGTLGTNTIVGVVSRGVVDNGYGYSALAFWPVYLPPSA